MNTEPVVRPYQSDDQSAVIDLLRASLGETQHLKRTSELFAWKHLDNPFGRSIMFVAEDGEGIVGFRALMRWELVTADGLWLKCVRPVDTATHPRARRSGVFRRLTMEALDEARADGVDLVFNTPNPRSGSGYLSMGWTQVGGIGAMVRLLPPKHWRPVETPPTVGSGVLWKDRAIEDRAPMGLRTPRSGEYLSWRFGSNPTARYWTVEGPTASVLLRPNVRKGRPELVVSEIFGEAQALLKAAARGSDATYMVGWFPPGTPERAVARRAGLMPIPRASVLTLLARPLRDIEIPFERLDQWDISLGDLELL